MNMIFGVKTSFFISLLLLVSANGWTGQYRLGDEIAGEVFVSWKAVVEKVSSEENEQAKIKARVEFAGQGLGGNRIRGKGKMRFVGPHDSGFNVGDLLQGDSALLKYWATVTDLYGSNFVIIGGVGMFDFAKREIVHFSPAVIELKAAIDAN